MAGLNFLGGYSSGGGGGGKGGGGGGKLLDFNWFKDHNNVALI